jgi:hypothetical protein
VKIRSVLVLIGLLIALPEILPGSDLVLDPPKFDFGTVEQGDEVNGSVSITSNSESPQEIRLISGCTCFIIQPETFVVEPGSIADFNWFLKTDDYDGPVTFQILVIAGADTERVMVSGYVNVSNHGRVVVLVIFSIFTVLLIFTLTIIRKRRNSK